MYMYIDTYYLLHIHMYMYTYMYMYMYTAHNVQCIRRLSVYMYVHKCTLVHNCVHVYTCVHTNMPVYNR